MIKGIDPSMTSSGVVVLSDSGEYIDSAQIPSTSGELISRRLGAIVKCIVAVCPLSEGDSCDVFIEEPAGELRGPAQDLRTLFWMIVDEFDSLRNQGMSISLYTVSPNTLKKFLTGRGNAGPPDKCLAVMNKYMSLFPEKYRVSVESTGGILKYADLYDGMGLAQLGLAYLTDRDGEYSEVISTVKKIV